MTVSGKARLEGPAPGGAGPDGLPPPPDAATLVVFGGSGDLARRLLFPALCNLRANGLLPRDFAIVGVGRRDSDDAAYREELGASVRRFAACPPGPEVWKDFAARTYFVQSDFGDEGSFRRLGARLAEPLDRLADARKLLDSVLKTKRKFNDVECFRNGSRRFFAILT